MDAVTHGEAPAPGGTPGGTPGGMLPPSSPLDMPVHSLSQLPPGERPGTPVTQWSGIVARRTVVLGGALGLTGWAAYEMNLVFNAISVSIAGVIMLALFVVLFLWIALAFTSALAGFCSLVSRRGGLGLGIHPDGPLPTLVARTALLMPTYNEDPGRVMAGLRAICDSLAATGQAGAFDLFVLSDTTDPDVWVAEEEAYMALCRATEGTIRVYYRRRPHNIDRKAGNIAEWVRRFGAAYQQMITLDADSVMSGDTIVRLTAAMEANPGVGLIQSLPVIVNGTTLFARMQQFAGRVYGPLIAHGIAWWHGAGRIAAPAGAQALWWGDHEP